MGDPADNLEIRAAVPSGGPLVRDYVAGEAGAVPFYGAHYASLAAYREKAAEVDGRFDRAARERAAAAITVPEGGDAERLERFVEDGGYVVTTGQQPGLFGGPLYSVYKALTAVVLARCLEGALGKPVLPLFWVASEDHDWAEADHTWMVGTDNELHRIAVDHPDPARHPALHRIPLGEGGADAVRAFLDALPPTEFAEPLEPLVRAAGAPDATLPGGFHGILHHLLGPHGVYFTDAADPVLKGASAEVLFQELERSEELEAILADTAERLEAAGYDTQVTLMDGGVNLFLDAAAGRERLYREEGAFRLRTSDAILTADEVRARFEEDPTVLSPNVLLRPVVESAVFPTLSYVAGPGETAYFAQLRGYFDALGVRMPVVHPRLGATVVESKIRKVLDKFELDVDDLARPFHEVSGAIARDEVPPSVKKALGALRGTVAKGVAELEKEVKSIDPTLKGPVQNVRSQAFQALDDAERKVVQALKRENEIALSQLEKAQLHLHPRGGPQERVMNPLYYVWRYGPGFLAAVVERFEALISPTDAV